jgi:hypothetical protein
MASQTDDLKMCKGASCLVFQFFGELRKQRAFERFEFQANAKESAHLLLQTSSQGNEYIVPSGTNY